MTQVIRQNTSAVQSTTVTASELKPYIGADVFIQHSIVDGKVIKTSGEWGKVEAVYEDYTVRVKSGDVFAVKSENSHFKTVY